MATDPDCRNEEWSDRVASIEQLLEQYRTTKNSAILRQAIVLWDKIEAERALQMTARQRTH